MEQVKGQPLSSQAPIFRLRSPLISTTVRTWDVTAAGPAGQLASWRLVQLKQPHTRNEPALKAGCVSRRGFTWPRCGRSTRSDLSGAWFGRGRMTRPVITRRRKCLYTDFNHSDNFNTNVHDRHCFCCFLNRYHNKSTVFTCVSDGPLNSFGLEKRFKSS